MDKNPIRPPSDLLTLERIACPLCGSEDSTRIATSADHLCGIEGEFHVERCRRCDHRFMNPRPILDDLATCYPDDYAPHQSIPEAEDDPSANANPAARPWYLRYLPLRYMPGLKPFVEWLLDDRSQIFPDPNDVRTGQSTNAPAALEVGCATGRYLQCLKQAGWTVKGVEPGSGPVAVARTAGLTVHHGSLDTYDCDPASFDLVTAWMVLEHVPDPRATLQQMSGALRPGGRLLISVPNAGCWESAFFGSDWYAWDLPRHLHHFSPNSIRRLLEECGFVRIQVLHQRTLLNVIGSLGIRLTRRYPAGRIGRWLHRYPHAPQLWMQLLLAPIAHGLAFMRQGGRLTICATKPNAPGTSSADAGSTL